MPTERVEASATTSLMGNCAFRENAQHLAADIAGRADDGDLVRHGTTLLGPRPSRGAQH